MLCGGNSTGGSNPPSSAFYHLKLHFKKQYPTHLPCAAIGPADCPDLARLLRFALLGNWASRYPDLARLLCLAIGPADYPDLARLLCLAIGPADYPDLARLLRFALLGDGASRLSRLSPFALLGDGASRLFRLGWLGHLRLHPFATLSA